MFLDTPRVPTKPPCCGTEGWIITSVVSLVSLAVASGAIGALIATVVNQQTTISTGAQCPLSALTTRANSVEFTQPPPPPTAATTPAPCQPNPDECNLSCQPCYSCLQTYTGQDAIGICMSNSPSRIAQCREQVFFLYDRPNFNNSMPCYDQCRSCWACINQTRQEEENLNGTLWETVYADYFEQPEPGANPFDDDDDSDEDDDDDEDADITASNDTHIMRRRKRAITAGFVADGDACCSTLRRREPYLVNFQDSFGVTWYPVWFFKSFAFPQYLFQNYDNIMCPIGNPLCSSGQRCIVQAQATQILMSKDAPHPETGHTFLFLTYPSSFVQFQEIQLPCYCMCSQ